MNAQELKNYNENQKVAILHWTSDFVYFLGTKIGHNPLDDHTLEEYVNIFATSPEFVECAKKYRENYEKEHNSDRS